MTKEIITAIITLLFGACQIGCLGRMTVQFDYASDGEFTKMETTKTVE